MAAALHGEEQPQPLTEADLLYLTTKCVHQWSRVLGGLQLSQVVNLRQDLGSNSRVGLAANEADERTITVDSLCSYGDTASVRNVHDGL